MLRSGVRGAALELARAAPRPTLSVRLARFAGSAAAPAFIAGGIGGGGGGGGGGAGMAAASLAPSAAAAVFTVSMGMAAAIAVAR